MLFPTFQFEYLFRTMGAVTTTPYVYLTDDSGIGAPHMQADTDQVTVERFADLLDSWCRIFAAQDACAPLAVVKLLAEPRPHVLARPDRALRTVRTFA